MTPSGHCLCGAVRYKFDADAVLWRAHCHCESCRRACAAPFTTFFGVRDTAWRWSGTPPARYRSSAGVERLFCARCGTQMAYRSARWPGEIHGYAATLTDSSGFEPSAHVNWLERVPWVTLGDDLPKHDATS